jgi:hypothetical protein
MGMRSRSTREMLSLYKNALSKVGWFWLRQLHHPSSSCFHVRRGRLPQPFDNEVLRRYLRTPPSSALLSLHCPPALHV